MEAHGSFFDDLAREIDWNGAFQAESADLLEDIKSNGPGNERISKFENLMQIGSYAAQYIDMQEAAARMRDNCCTPELASMVENSDSLGSYTRNYGDNHTDCDDDHEETAAKTKKAKKKKKQKQQQASLSIADLLAKYWAPAQRKISLA